MPRVVDGTAAGDAFRAALAVALAEKQVGRRGARFVSRMEGYGRKLLLSRLSILQASYLLEVM